MYTILNTKPSGLLQNRRSQRASAGESPVRVWEFTRYGGEGPERAQVPLSRDHSRDSEQELRFFIEFWNHRRESRGAGVIQQWFRVYKAREDEPGHSDTCAESAFQQI